MNNIIEQYCQILLENIKEDQEFINNPYYVITVVPLAFYCIFALIKWYFLLAPLTIPFSLFSWGVKFQKFVEYFKKKN